MTTTQITGPAVRVFDATNIDRLAVHLIVGDDQHAACNPALRALFVGTCDEITCKRCLRLGDER